MIPTIRYGLFMHLLFLAYVQQILIKSAMVSSRKVYDWPMDIEVQLKRSFEILNFLNDFQVRVGYVLRYVRKYLYLFYYSID